MFLKILTTFLFSFLLISEAAFSQATLDAPPQVNAGAEFKVNWTGPDNERDFITLVKEGTEEKTYGKYVYTKKGNPLKLRAPDDDGNYELRYLEGQTRETLGSLPINVLPTTATLNAPPDAAAGSEIKVNWEGPNNKGDFITIVKEGAEERKYGRYVYTKKGTPVKLKLPDEAGSYEIRYLTGQKYFTLASLPITINATSANLEAPPESPAGAEIKISWTGPDNSGDFITIVSEGAEERTYKKYVYTKRGNPVKLKVPDEAGSYEIRYLTGQKYKTLASLPINITSTTATLETTPQAIAGSEVKINWTGPDNNGDFITIVKAGAEEKTYKRYVYTKRGNPVKLKVPDEAGDYELRYLTAQSYSTLASLPITITATGATLDFEPEAVAGSELKVAWTGPDNNGDFITIVKSGAEEKTYKRYVYTKKGNPLKILVPDEEGSYEVRYLTAQSYNTLGSMPLSILPPSATLEAPPEVIANEVFKVKWTGPDNQGDYVAIFDTGVEDAKYKSYAYTRRGNPLKIQAPKTPGLHEIKYLMGQSGKNLASIEVNVIKSKVPGTLKLVSTANDDGNTQTITTGAVELILDASGSMLKRLDGTPRIKIAKEAVTDLVKNSLEPGTPFAMRVFGHKDADSCRTDLEISLKPLDKTSAISNIRSINAKNLAKTPIAKSLSLVSEDLAGIEGKAIIVLVTDGEETCEGDPKAAIQSLKDSGYDVRVNIVGFAIDELELKETFREWANVGNGSYFDAKNAEELGKSIQKAIEIPFEVINAENEVVATGALNGDAVEVPAGNYSIKVLSGKTTTISDVTIESEKEKVVTFE